MSCIFARVREKGIGVGRSLVPMWRVGRWPERRAGAATARTRAAAAWNADEGSSVGAERVDEVVRGGRHGERRDRGRARGTSGRRRVGQAEVAKDSAGDVGFGLEGGAEALDEGDRAVGIGAREAQTR